MVQKHLLVTIGDDLSALHAVRFVSSFFKYKSNVRVTLFYVAPQAGTSAAAPGFVRHDPTRKTKASDGYMEKGRKALDASLGLLQHRGFPVECVDSKLATREFGTVADIIREGKKVLYDAVILGRRGYAMFESFLSYSVTREIMDRDITFPLWICRQIEEHRTNVLLCVDGSDASLRMADHTGFMLADEPEHTVTVLHVNDGEAPNVEAVLESARGMLRENGMPEERIKLLVKPSRKVVDTVLHEVEAGKYAAVGVGRVGIHKSLFKEWTVGSRSMKLLENLEKAALWVSK